MMTLEEAARITNACDIVCENCDRKTCDECVVAEIKNNALGEYYVEDECSDEPDENFFDDEDTVYPDPSEDVWDGMA